MSLIAYYTDDFGLPLPEQHKFPMDKYARTRQEALKRNILTPEQLKHPRAASNEDLLRVHTPEYLQRVLRGELSAKEIRRIGFPWSKQLVERSRRSVGATIDAALAALEYGVGLNLAGGTHHAFAHKGEGFCVFNDAMVAAKFLEHHSRAAKIAIIDLDVHQGNGTASLAQSEPNIFSFSIHSKTNFPYHKEQSKLDIALDDGTTDEVYLQNLESGLSQLKKQFKPDFVFYLAGADPYKDDRFGTLSLTKQGLAKRDTAVMHWCINESVPVAISMAGGYATRVEDIVDIHLTTVKLSRLALFCNRPDLQQKQLRSHHAS